MISHCRVRALVALLLVLSAFWPVASHAAPAAELAVGSKNTLVRFAVLAFRPKPEMIAKWQPLIDHLNASGIGRHFELNILTYAELEEAVRERRVDVVLTQPAHYILLAHSNGLLSPLATLVERAGEHKLSQFGGVMLARADRQDIQTLSDLRGKRIATSQMDSLGSFQMQALELRRQQISLPGDAVVIETGQPQDKAIVALLEDQADVAFVRTGVLEAMVKKGRLVADQLRVIHPTTPTSGYPLVTSTRLYPEWPLAIMPWMDEELARWLAAAVLSLPHDGKVSQAIGIVGFTIPLDYEPVEALMRELRLPPFDKAPEITWRDVLATYHNHFLILLALTLGLSLGTALVLFRMNRRLTQDKVQISRMVDQLRANEGELESLVGNLRSETKERKAFAEALTRTNAELTRLGVVMAHHFQEPVRRMAGFAQRLLSKSTLANDADSRQSLEFIDQQARRLSELVRDVQRNLALDYAEVGASETANSGAALHQSIAAAGMAASDADISLREPLPTVRMTEKRLRELFAILLDNALRYRHSERPLRIEVSATVTGDRAAFRFADNGSGIAPEYRAQVFELFTRLVPNSVPGTGMGLALVRKIIKQAGGNVCVEDGLDGGACIAFDSPVESNL